MPLQRGLVPEQVLNRDHLLEHVNNHVIASLHPPADD